MVAEDRWDQRNYSNYSQETLNLYCAREILGGVPGHKYRHLPLGFSIENILPTLQYTNPTIVLSELLKVLILNFSNHEASPYPYFCVARSYWAILQHAREKEL
jgi:hypothetical protein